MTDLTDRGLRRPFTYIGVPFPKMLYKVAVACALAASASALPVELDSSDVQKKWEAWKKEHKFEFTVEEEALKYGKFFATVPKT